MADKFVIAHFDWWGMVDFHPDFAVFVCLVAVDDGGLVCAGFRYTRMISS
ncbi:MULTISPECIES: hypothetical protein [unclassified Moraxella]